MQITDIVAYPLRVSLDKPSWNAHGKRTADSLIIVEVKTDRDIVGIGEIQSGPQHRVCEYIQLFNEIIVGRDPREISHIWELLLSTTSPRPGGLGDWDGIPAPLPRDHRAQILAAIGGIDIALWDIKGKATNMPVFRLLGGSETEMFAYVTDGYYYEDKGPGDYAADFERHVAAGFDAVKMKSGALSLESEVERVAAVREAIGPSTRFMLDLNASFGLQSAIEFAEAVAEFDIQWLEEPLHWYLQPADFTRLANSTTIPLAHGEREWHRFTTRDFITSGAINYVQFDATRRGGFTESLRVATLAEQHNVIVAPHTAPHIHAHLVSAFDRSAFGVEARGNEIRNPIQANIYEGGPIEQNGRVTLTEDPGFGVQLNRELLEKWTVTSVSKS